MVEARKILKASWYLMGGRTRVDIGGGRFIGLDDKIRGASSAAEWQLWKARGIIVKLASRRNEVIKAACMSGAPTKRWKVLSLRIFLLYV